MEINKELNYYQILNLPFNFEHKELKNNYRKLSKEHHPDKNGGDDANFKIINEAYKVLSDKESKDRYDKESKFGQIYDPLLELLDFEFSNSNVSSDKINDRMEKFKKKEMLHIVLELGEFKDIVEYTRDIICSKCEGRGSSSIMDLNLNTTKDGKAVGSLFDNDEEIECDICDKTGTYNGRECPGCKGEGYIKLGLSKCTKCDGQGVMEVSKTVKLKKGSFVDNKLKMDYYGNQSKYNGKSGNLYIILKDQK